MNNISIKNIIFNNFICNFELFYTCNFPIHKRLFDEIKTFLMEKEMLVDFKKNLGISKLIYALNVLYNIDRALQFFKMKNFDENCNNLNFN